MYIFRFMSYNEFNKFINGELLVNDKVHKGKTSSVGFCFFSENDTLNDLENVKLDCKFNWQFLNGAITDPDVCCIFEVDRGLLSEGYGTYADPYGSFWDTIDVKELSCKEYNRDKFKLICYCTNFMKFDSWNEEADWKWINF